MPVLALREIEVLRQFGVSPFFFLIIVVMMLR
jgi:hypothetical protein